MKKIIFLLLISILFSSCSSENDSNPAEELPTSANRIVNIKQYDSNNILIQDLNYFYDDFFRLIEASDDDNLTFYYKYTNGKLTSYMLVLYLLSVPQSLVASMRGTPSRRCH